MRASSSVTIAVTTALLLGSYAACKEQPEGGPNSGSTASSASGGGGSGGGDVDTTIKFFFDPNDGGVLTCNGVVADKPPNGPATCGFDASGELTVSRAGWKGGSAVLSADLTLAGRCRGSVVPHAPRTYDLLADCALVDEWFTDLPWHQKLSTVHSNVIDVAFVMPFEAIRFDDLPNGKSCASANTPSSIARCMLRYGIVNVMAMHRTDTLYPSGDAPAMQDCSGGDCVEVKFEIQRFNSRTDDALGYAPDPYREAPYNDGSIAVPSLGFAITEATIFAPWRPWYMGHYCGVEKHTIDAVCYDDYFTTQLQAAADPPGAPWLDDYPAIFEPRGTTGIFQRYCADGAKSCTMRLGKIDWLDNATAPQIASGGCGNDPEQTCADEITTKTGQLDDWFNQALAQYVDVGRYPWAESPKTAAALSAAIATNPFIGFYALKTYGVGAGGRLYKAPRYVLPKECTKANFSAARHGSAEGVAALKRCALDFEVHTSGFHEQWKQLYGGDLGKDAILAKNVAEIGKAVPGTAANQYGRTMFVMAGVGEQKIAVSYALADDGMSIHDKVYGSSIYTQYLPMVNPADQTLFERFYQNDFWHGALMSNHMNQTPDHFIRGIRGRTLWHNEHRSKQMYYSAEVATPSPAIGTAFEGKLGHVDFAAGFQVGKHTAPFHGNTCDSCHVRNGSGIPLMPNGKLPAIHVSRGMKDQFVVKSDINGDRPDYTYTNAVVPGDPNDPGTAIRFPSMKMVLFDLGATPPTCGAPVHRSAAYTNKVMNFYGDTFQVNQEGAGQGKRLPTYDMDYVPIAMGDGFEIVDPTPRGNGNMHPPRRVVVSNFVTGNRCKDLAQVPSSVDPASWPASCAEVSDGAIEDAIAAGKIGYMHLLGRRLGNTPLIEMIPDELITDTQAEQSSSFTHAGCFTLAPGTRIGNDGAMSYRSCASGKLGSSEADCYIGRWGWIGDRASLEDQVANAASVEMNVTTHEGYAALHPGAPADQRVRYDKALCGPADATCLQGTPNSDITEEEVRNMATYQRWIGIPQRSEYQVESKIVQQGEKIFQDLHCNSCHVIRKVPFIELDNMLPDEERQHLKSLQIVTEKSPDYPFVSYLGTDLLEHDMGYLSQVARAPGADVIRNPDGTVKATYGAYVRRIRTPALKGLRFNAFVTDSNHNTNNPIRKNVDQKQIIPGCDFLLHDGRACNAIEAAYLHDGPAIKALGTIIALNALAPDDLKALRAFLYSL